MGNGPGGTAPGPFPLIVILRGGAVPPNSGAVPPGPFPMDKLNGPSGSFWMTPKDDLKILNYFDVVTISKIFYCFEKLIEYFL